MGQPYDFVCAYDWAGSYDGGVALTTPTPSNLSSTRVSYIAPTSRSVVLGSKWSDGAPLFSDTRIRFGQISPRQSLHIQPWTESTKFEHACRIIYTEGTPHQSAQHMPWNEASTFEHIARVRYRAAQHLLQNAFVSPWGQITTHDGVTAFVWGSAAPHESTTRAPWNATKPREIVYRIIWVPGQKSNSGYGLGWTNQPPLPPGTPITVPSADSYYMTPVLSILRASDNADLKPFDCTIKLDVSSYAWTIQANCPRASLPLIDPNTNPDPVVVQSTINGYVGNFIIESYTDTRKFGGTGIQVSGRTRHALLGPPYAPLSTYTETTSKNASQLVSDILTPLGYGLTWSTVDYLVPGGTFTYADLTPIEAIAQVLNAIGAILIPDLEALSFTVVPMYPVSPWNWPTTTPAVIVPESFWTQISGQWEGSGQPNYDGIYVSGQNGGVVGLVKITGTAGDNLIPTVSDPLLVNVDANRERGRIEIAKARKRKTETMTQLLLPSPVSETNPGIIMPTTLLQATDIDGSTWLGQVMSTQINVAQSNSALSVRQVQAVERHA